MPALKRFLLFVFALSAALHSKAQVSVSFYNDGGDGFTHNGFVLSSTPPMNYNGGSVFFDGTFQSYYMPSFSNPSFANQPVTLLSRVNLNSNPDPDIVLILYNPAENGEAQGYNPNPGTNPFGPDGMNPHPLYAPVNPNNQIRWVITGLHPTDPTKRYDSITFFHRESNADLTLSSSIDPISGDITITATDWTNFNDPEDYSYFGGNVNIGGYFTTTDVAAVPEPASAALVLAAAAGGVVWWRRRRTS